MDDGDGFEHFGPPSFRTPPADALSGIEEQARRALAGARLEAFDDGSYRWRWDHGDDLRSPLRPLAHATVELLGEGPVERRRERRS
jgi:hypothetical protein